MERTERTTNKIQEEVKVEMREMRKHQTERKGLKKNR